MLLLLVPVRTSGDPVFGEIFSHREPDGRRIDVRVWGDEFYRVVESLDGYTLVRDPHSGQTCYARLSADGNELLSTGVPVAERSADALDLSRHIRINPASARKKAETARARLDEELIQAAPLRGTESAVPPNIGHVKGIVLLVDFEDDPSTVPASEVDNYCNLVGYSGYGNNGSVRDYFYDVSDGLLTYTNFVPPVYYRAANPKTYYTDPNVSLGVRARELVTEALNALDAAGLDFSQYDSNGDGLIDAINCFYAGGRDNVWAEGLWPHTGPVTFEADGVSAWRYQISDIGDSLYLNTFCHENGHMICYWPDLYDYGHESTGIGKFCLMCNTASPTNPVEPCAYLKQIAGWSTTTTLTTAQAGLSAPTGTNESYKYDHPFRPNEYYLIENRQQIGRDAAIPDSGLAIWHVDTYGSNDNEQMTFGSHYRVTLVQADGNWDLERGVNRGDDSDLWAGPSDAQCGPRTDPSTRWWDEVPPSLYVYDISPSAATMTFSFFADCNDNLIPDDCDLGCDGACASVFECGLSEDCQGDGIPDECQLGTIVAAVPTYVPACSEDATDGTPWCDDFEAYALGAIADNGWGGWYGDPSAAGLVTDERNHTPGGAQSLKIANHDTVHVFTGYGPSTSWFWVLRAWVYVPSTMSGEAFFIVNADYDPDWITRWAVELLMDPAAGMIVNDFGVETLPLVTDRWVEIRCEIDFYLNRGVTIYYDDQFLAASSWTERGGSLNIGAIDLYGPGSNGFYYDDISLYPLESYTSDCNVNRIPDECDVAGGESRDRNDNGVPDECDFPVDVDGDADFDLDDYNVIVACMTGPGASHLPGCETSDLDGDGDCDLYDSGLFQRAFTGPLR